MVDTPLLSVILVKSIGLLASFWTRVAVSGCRGCLVKMDNGLFNLYQCLPFETHVQTPRDLDEAKTSAATSSYGRWMRLCWEASALAAAILPAFD